jgi:hypothetical protein
MVFGIGSIVALICIAISIIFAVVTHQAANATRYSLCFGGAPKRPGEAEAFVRTSAHPLRIVHGQLR